MGTHSGQMGVEFVGHAVDPVTNIPFPQASTQLHRQPHMLADNQVSFVGTLNIAAIERRRTDRPQTLSYQHGLLTSTRTERYRGIALQHPLGIILGLPVPYQNRLHHAVSSATASAEGVLRRPSPATASAEGFGSPFPSRPDTSARPSSCVVAGSGALSWQQRVATLPGSRGAMACQI